MENLDGSMDREQGCWSGIFEGQFAAKVDCEVDHSQSQDSPSKSTRMMEIMPSILVSGTLALLLMNSPYMAMS